MISRAIGKAKKLKITKLSNLALDVMNNITEQVRLEGATVAHLLQPSC